MDIDCSDEDDDDDDDDDMMMMMMLMMLMMLMMMMMQRCVTYSVYHYVQAECKFRYLRLSGKVNKSSNLTPK